MFITFSLCLLQQHWNENKWTLGDRWTKLLTDKGVTCVGHTVKADFTRVFNTFFPDNCNDFTPRYVDVTKLWQISNGESYRLTNKKTLDIMMANFNWVLRKNKNIRQSVWRTMGQLTILQMEYAVLDALSCLFLFRQYSGMCIQNHISHHHC